MASIIESISGEFRRCKALVEAALDQLRDDELTAPGAGGGNSVGVICWHVAGNLRSRFTDFLDSDGEKPWRRREEEFQPRAVTRAELLAQWESGWDVLFQALARLTDADLTRTVTIRRQPLLVHEALYRSLGHAAYHTGQVIYAARGLRGAEWRFLSIPPGQSDAYNARAGSEAPEAHIAALRDAVR